MAFRNSRGRWELDGDELISGSVVEVNLSGQWIRASVKYDSNHLKDYCLLLNGGGTLLMSTTTKLPRLRAAPGESND